MSLAGCGGKGAVLPEAGPTMLEIYRSHVGAIGVEPAGLGPHSFEADLSDYTRTAENEINALFVRLPNPDLVMYVFPHLSTDDEVPVPGYSTVFPLYERVHYALPGELP